MAFYRKKPVVVEAVRIRDLMRMRHEDQSAVPTWVTAGYDSGVLHFADDFLQVTTMEGVMQGRRDDWLVKGTKGELYPVKPEIFAEIYEDA